MRGQITYDDRCGHVCTCAERRRATPTIGADDDTYGPVYDRTVVADPRIVATETGAYWYTCTRCGAGGWSGL